MKRTLSLILPLILLLSGVFAFAEEAQVIEVTFDGSYLECEEYGFKIYLPNEWNVYDDDQYYLCAGNDEETQFMAIDVLEVNGATLLEIAESVAAEEGITDVASLTINGIEFIVYTAEADGYFGALLNTENNIYCLHFIFAPYGNEDFMNLATQIMVSVDTL